MGRLGCHRPLCSSTTWGCLPLCSSTTTTNRGKAIGNNLSAAPPPPDMSTRRAAVSAPTGHTRPRRIQCTVSPRGRGANDKPHAPVRDTFTAVRYYMTPGPFCSLRRAHSVLQHFGRSLEVGTAGEFANSRLCENSVALFLLAFLYITTPTLSYYTIITI